MEPIGKLAFNGIETQLYYDNTSRCEIEILDLGERFLVKGSKNYVILDATDVKEFQSRLNNIPTFLDYIRSFPELQIKIFWLSELIPQLLDIEPNRDGLGLEDVQTEISRQNMIKYYVDLSLPQLESRFSTISNDPTKSLERACIRDNLNQLSTFKRVANKNLDELKQRISDSLQQEDDTTKLIQGYLQHGVASCFLITTSSNAYYIEKNGLRKAVDFVVKDLKDYDQIIKQRAVQGFHLVIQELDMPTLFLAKTTILNPNYLGRLSESFPELKPLFESVKSKFIVKPVNDIVLKNRGISRNVSLAHVVASLLKRSVQLEETTKLIPQPDFEKLPKFVQGKRLAYVGLIAGNDFKPKPNPVLFDIDMQFPTHMMIAGQSGSGKSIAAQVIIESCLFQGIPCITIDPTNQWAGFLKKCEDKRMLSIYKQFGLKEHFPDFPVEIYSKEFPSMEEMLLRPQLTVLSTKGLEHEEMDEVVFGVAKQIFDHFTKQSESNEVKAVIVFEEAHKLAPGEKGASVKAINLLGECTRQMRKYGCSILYITQMVKDFAAYIPGGRAIRGNTSTKIQMRTSYEGDLNRILTSYGTEYQKLIPILPTGVGLVEFNDYGKPFFTCFRPVLHHPYSLTKEEMERFGIDRNLQIPESLLKTRNEREFGLSEDEGILLNFLLENKDEGISISQVVRALKHSIPSVGRIYSAKTGLVEKGLLLIINENGRKLLKLENGGISGISSKMVGKPERGLRNVGI